MKYLGKKEREKKKIVFFVLNKIKKRKYIK